ncbi:unnamed protein product [Prorocentrum cordatum]|uniref:Uncharacterized protein n=1 Tax=Prorocentrum cordatum TaxID=2364126 RepID=A0ABN9W8L6_9DINO|nr:unnamed protein product [Polarella glacialis]
MQILPGPRDGEAEPLAAACACGPARPSCAARAFGLHLREEAEAGRKAVAPQCPDCGAAYVGKWGRCAWMRTWPNSSAARAGCWQSRCCGTSRLSTGATGQS